MNKNISILTWRTETLAYEALEDCDEMLTRRKFRHAVRCAHDAMNCSFLLFFYQEKHEEGFPFVRGKRLLKFLEETKNQGVIFFEKEEERHLLAVSTSRYLLKMLKEIEFPGAPDSTPSAEFLIEIRDSLEHPSPYGETGWTLLEVLKAISSGLEYAFWALHKVESADRYRLQLSKDRLKRHFPNELAF